MKKEKYITYVCSGSWFRKYFWNTIWQQKIRAEHMSFIEIRKEKYWGAEEAEIIRKM